MNQSHQALFADGVDKDAFGIRRDCFENCSICFEEFGPDLVPALTACGHFVCRAPSCQFITSCPVCQKQLHIKYQKYDKYLKVSSSIRGYVNAEGQRFFNIVLEVGGNKTSKENISSSVILGEFLEGFHQFLNFKELFENGTALIINGRVQFYKKIKNIQLGDPQLRLRDNSSNSFNIIKVYDRYGGGKSQ